MKKLQIPSLRTLFRRGLATLTVAILASAAGSSPAGAQGSAQEPVVVRDINPGAASSTPEELVPVGRELFFRATDGTTGFELWKSDGTEEGTVQVADFRAGPPNGFPANLAAVRGDLYFTAYDTPVAEGSKVFRLDPRTGEITLLADTYPGLPADPFGPPLPGKFIRYRNLVLFAATAPETGNELWRTDGTPEGTALVTDLHPGPESSIPVDITPFRGLVFYGADDSVVIDPNGFAIFDRELFRSDATEEGTFRVQDINPGPEPSIPFDFTRFRGRLFFVATDPDFGREVWRTDGRPEGTARVTDVNPGAGGSLPQDLTRLGRWLLFTALDGSSGFELWRTDGTEQGTRMVKDINPADGSVPLNLTPVGRHVFFTADDGEHGNELWISNGTEQGTRMVKDINPGPELSGPLGFTMVGREVYFTVVKQTGQGDGAVTTALWKSDGSEEGTRLVWEAPGISFGYSITDLRLIGRNLFFVAPAEVDPLGMSTNYELQVLEVGGHGPFPRRAELLEERALEDEVLGGGLEPEALEDWIPEDATADPRAREAPRAPDGL